ncbi:hypothetical protein Zmor_008958 [Zophobas morio]|uniref:Uncharacterized protein n=1 Tax=Zophobas morio TaxID=2755281 RepID=A0AA38HH44_9CUCU|nr:hypothetical protein Zmor_008958 [Zophobas morio]
MESDLGLHVETKDASYSTQQVNNMLSAETTIMEAPKAAPSAPAQSAPDEDFHVSAPSFGGMPSPSESPMGTSAPMQAPSFASEPTPAPQMASQQVVTEMRQAVPSNSNPAEGVKIDQIERRMENIEKMIQSLSLAQNYQAPNSNIDSEKVNKLKDEFSKIEEQLSRISQTFDVTGTEPKNLFGALIRGYKYNNKK